MNDRAVDHTKGLAPLADAIAHDADDLATETERLRLVHDKQELRRRVERERQIAAANEAPGL